MAVAQELEQQHSIAPEKALVQHRFGKFFGLNEPRIQGSLQVQYSPELPVATNALIAYKGVNHESESGYTFLHFVLKDRPGQTYVLAITPQGKINTFFKEEFEDGNAFTVGVDDPFFSINMFHALAQRGEAKDYVWGAKVEDAVYLALDDNLGAEHLPGYQPLDITKKIKGRTTVDYVALQGLAPRQAYRYEIEVANLPLPEQRLSTNNYGKWAAEVVKIKAKHERAEIF
jgi:hypothetical protein